MSRGLGFVTLDTTPPMKRLDDGGLELIEDHLDRHPECRVLIIDTWSRLKPVKGVKKNEYDQDAAAWAILQNLATKRRIAIVVVHHTRKPLVQGGDWLLEVSGTTGVTGTADTLIFFKRQRGESTATIQITGREHDEDREFALVGDPATKTWRLASKAADDVRLQGGIEKVAKVLEAQGAMWPREIQEATGLGNVRALLQRMIERGIVERDSRDKYRLTIAYRYSDTSGTRSTVDTPDTPDTGSIGSTSRTNRIRCISSHSDDEAPF